MMRRIKKGKEVRVGWLLHISDLGVPGGLPGLLTMAESCPTLFVSLRVWYVYHGSDSLKQEKGV